jgi:hypothetical protein
MNSETSDEVMEDATTVASDPRRFQKYVAHYNATMRDIFEGAATAPEFIGAPGNGTNRVRRIMMGMLVGLGNFMKENKSSELPADVVAAMEDAERVAYESWLRIEQTLENDRGCIRAFLLEHKDPRAKLI